MNPLINIPDSAQSCPVHLMITKPGAIFGEDAEKEEIARLLPKPDDGKYWEYQQVSAQPLRFATMEDADSFMKDVAEHKASDQYFVPAMYYDGRRKKWCVSKRWGEAVGELVVFVQKPMAKELKVDVSLENNQFQCALCKGVFTRSSDWTHESAKAEHDKNFPGESLESATSVCDDCYQKIAPSIQASD